MNSISENKIILVTGGAGYIGSVLVDQLLSDGNKVRVLDRLDFGEDSLKQLSNDKNFELIVGDITNKDHVATAMKSVYAVVHLAAIVGEPACNKNEEEAMRVNLEGSLMLYKIACEEKVDRFLFSSTCSNYGRANGEQQLVDESAELQPLSTYSKTKVTFEQKLLTENSDHISGTVLRFATAFGLSFRPRFDLTVNEFTRDLACKKELEIFGEQFWRPYCHTTDLARACRMVIESPTEKVAGKAFNVGSTDQNYTKRQLVDLIEERIPGCMKHVRFIHRLNDLRDYRVSFDKINSDLGYYTIKSVPDGIDEIATAIETGKFKDPFDRKYQNV